MLCNETVSVLALHGDAMTRLYRCRYQLNRIRANVYISLLTALLPKGETEVTGLIKALPGSHGIPPSSARVIRSKL